MAFEEDLIKEEPTNVDVEGRKFKIRELYPTEVDKIDSECLVLDNETGALITYKSDLKNLEYLTKCVVDSPYEWLGKKFKDLTEEERRNFFSKNPKNRIRTLLLNEINELHGLKKSAKKKSNPSSSKEKPVTTKS